MFQEKKDKVKKSRRYTASPKWIKKYGSEKDGSKEPQFPRQVTLLHHIHILGLI